MKKLPILIFTLIISFLVCAFASTQVSAALTVSVNPVGPVTLNVGQVQVFTAAASGGSGSLSYQWYLDGNPVGSNSETYSYTASGAGTPHSIICNVTDSTSVPVTSNVVSVTVNSALVAPTVSASPGTVTQGQTSSLTSSAVITGTSPYAYQWLQKAPGAGSYSSISGATSASYSFVTSGSTTAGSWSFELQVTDNASASVMSNAASVTVNAVPTLTVAVSPASWVMDVGQNKTFTATASGGSGTYTGYQWYVNGAPQSGATASTFNYVPASAGPYSITVTVTDSLGSTSAQSSPASVTVNASPSVSITPVGPIALNVGQAQVFTATATGGSGTLSYQWYLDGNAVGSNSATYSYTATAAGSHSVTCKVTDSASVPVTSPASNAVSVTINTALGVVVSPTSWAMNIGQSKIFNATASGGSGTYSSYQWYVNGTLQSGATASTFSYTANLAGSYLITVTVTDSLGSTSAQSSPASVKVNSALVAPTVSASPSKVTQGQISSLTSSAVTTGTSPYTYKWFARVPGADIYSFIDGAASPSYSFATNNSMVTGDWSFILQVTDTAGQSVNSSAVTVTLNYAPIDHFIFIPVGDQVAGTSFAITITAKDASNNTLTHYNGINTLSVSNGTINPTATAAFSNGVWTGSINLTQAGAVIWLLTSGSGMSGVSNSFTVNPGALDHFIVSALNGTITNGASFNITVTAKDAYNNTVTSYTGTPSLTFSAGSISPSVMNAFVNGIGSTLVTINAESSSGTISIQDGTHTGVSSQITVLGAFGSILAVGIAIPEILLIFSVIAFKRLKQKPDNS